jgi:hypothetical protein
LWREIYTDALRIQVAAVLAVGLAFAVGIPMGFVLRPKLAGVSDDVFGAALGIAIPAAAVVMTWLFVGAPMPRRRVRVQLSPIQQAEQARIIAEQEAYAASSAQTACCPHLRAVEAAIRAAGVKTHLLAWSATDRAVWAQCRIDEKALRRQFDLPRWVAYEEGYYSDRDQNDTPRADLVCQRCRDAGTPGSSIVVIHPESYSENAPWFPAPLRGPRS